jgi:peptidoglycan/xylan/chitin deacetylase (PgdA/CDA1 family)
MPDEEHADVEWRRARRARQREARKRHRKIAARIAAAVAAGGAAAAVAIVLVDRGAGSAHEATTAAARAGASSAPLVRRTEHRAATVAELLRARNAAVPILMYHVIASPVATAPYPGLYVPPAEFRGQMRGLAAAGFHGVTLDRVRAAWQGTATLPTKPIVITFDNGYRTQYTEALPVLRRIGWVAVENLQLTGLPPKEGGLNKRQIRALVAAGWELDTQGYNHADLNTLDTQELHFQIAVTRRRLRRLYGVPVNWFCYPSGHYNAAVVAAVEAAGYVGSTTVVPGWARRNDNPYELPRLRVLGGTSPRALLALIAGSEHSQPPPASYPAGA